MITPGEHETGGSARRQGRRWVLSSFEETRDAAVEVAADHPEFSLAWALLAESALAEGQPVMAYAYARTGYHRGLDQLRRAGWKGHGPVPWEHEPNRGFLRALHALGQAAEAIGEVDEAERCRAFLVDASPTAVSILSGGRLEA